METEEKQTIETTIPEDALAQDLEASRAAIAELNQKLAIKESEILALTQSLTDSNKALDEAGKALPKAVAAYRELVIQVNPGVLAEMVSGDTIDSVNDSLKSARALVEKVKREIEAEASRQRVPAGAPQRLPPDISGLTAREKIQYALGGS